MKRWVLKKSELQKAQELTRQYGLQPLLARVLAARGMTDEDDLRRFFAVSEELSDPFLIHDMDKAVARIRVAVEEGERICIYGDYDADGVTATALMVRYLDMLGADVTYYIPEREGEGYGMNAAALDKIAAEGVNLIVTVDNGISAVDEVEYAKTLGMDVVITDHHMPPAVLPEAIAVVDPHRKDETAPFRDFAGVGVAFKLLCALEDGDSEAIVEQFSEIAAIGTVADVVPLVGENRTLVKAGLHRMASTDNLGLYSLMEVCSLADQEMTADRVAFMLAPKINAAGRVGTVQDAIRLFLDDDEEAVMRLATNMASLNQKRKELEDIVLTDIGDQIAKNPHLVNRRVLILSGHGWHKGVIGIVAARLAEQYGKPTILIAIDEDGVGGGSARSNAGFSIVNALRACPTYLRRFGGHAKAAGFAVDEADIPAFTEELLAYAKQNYPIMPPYEVEIDTLVSPAELTVEAVEALEQMQPFGEDNKRPIFAVSGAVIEDILPLSQGKHLRLKLSKDQKSFTVLCFGHAPENFPYTRGDRVDICFTAEPNVYNGITQVSLKLCDLKSADIKQDALFGDLARYEAFVTDEGGAVGDLPTREDMALLYRLFREKGGFNGAALQLYRLVHEQMNYCKMMLALEILKSEKLITAATHCEHLGITLLPVAGKIDLAASEQLRHFQQLTK